MRNVIRQLRTTNKQFVILILVGVLAFTPLGGLVSANEPAEGWLAPGEPLIASNEIADATIPPDNTDCDLTNHDMITREAKEISQSPFFQTELRRTATCAVQTPRGIHDGVYLDAGVPAGKFQGHAGAVLRIPNSNKLIALQTYISGSAMTMDWYDYIVPQYNQVTGEVVYNLAGRTRFKNKAETEIYIRPEAYGYSSNGKWMVAASSVGFIRINLETREVLPFAPGVTGTGTFVTVAISDDGRYAVRGVSTTSGNSLWLYDLSTCAQPPEVITGPVSCQYKDIKPVLEQNSLNFTRHTVRFITPELLALRTTKRNSDGTITRYSVRMAPSGQTIESISYLALGDSFSSGEGAYDYEVGTDEPENNCHLSRNSYPYLIAAQLELTNFHSVACSGAKYDPNYAEDPQHIAPFAPEWLAGSKTQQAFVSQAKPEVITVSMIGNDIGFKDKIVRCLAPDSCFHYLEDRQSIVDEINSKFYTLFAMYANIKKNAKEGAKIYVLGYPQLFSVTGDCRFSVNLDAEERETARDLVGYLNTVIKAAAERAGVRYIDVENAFQGHLLCGGGEEAANGLMSGNDVGAFGINIVGNESFHPNRLGHQLFADALLEQSQLFSADMPVPDSTKAAPDSSSEAYTNFIRNAPSGGTLKRIAFVGTDMIRGVIKSGPMDVVTDIVLPANSPFEAWFNSEPTYAGTLLSDEGGRLRGGIVVPEGLDPGFHTLHLYGKDLANKDIDLYETVYVAASADDFDGDGVLNGDESCLVTEPINVDYDRDGIDDACDPEIDEPPADSTPPKVVGVPDRESNADSWYNDDVTISWTATDPEPSSGAPTQPASTVANQEESHTYVSDPSCDPLMNCATGKLTLAIDKTAPTLGIVAWTNNPKSVLSTAAITILATDNLSGITEAEYYLGDTDPGLGNGATMQVNDDSISVGFNTDFPTGVYKVTMRAKDGAGNWSQPLADYLVVYDPFGTRMTGKRTLIPSLSGADVLPGLVDSSQADKAKFGFNVRYDKDGEIHKNSDFQFVYETGAQCKKPAKAQNCHRFELNATSITWLVTQGQNDSTGIFQGAATLEVDDTTTNVTFRLTGLDGERLDQESGDHLTLKVYTEAASPNADAPLYQVSANVLRGNIKISKW